MNSLRQKPPVAADQTVFSERGPLKLPLDLRQWASDETLVKWVREEIENLDSQTPGVKEHRSSTDPRANTMLQVLVLAYAVQLLVSDDIVAACRSEKIFQDLCAGKTPFAHELEGFRRQNRVLLENALGALLVRATKERFSKLGKLPPGVEYGIQVRAVDRLDSARRMDDVDE